MRRGAAELVSTILCMAIWLRSREMFISKSSSTVTVRITRPYWTLPRRETRVVAAMARQHRTILRALIAQDWTRARRELTRHIRAQRPIVRELLQRIGTG